MNEIELICWLCMSQEVEGIVVVTNDKKEANGWKCVLRVPAAGDSDH
mgnify:CR=1 FL=1